MDTELQDRRHGPSPYRTLLRAVIMLSAAIVILTGLVTVTIVRLVDESANQHQIQNVEAAQHRILLAGCRRGNVLRRTDNATHLSDYIVFTFIEKRFLIPNPAETRKQQRVTRLFAAKLIAAVHAATWTPTTNCQQAINTQGSQYQSPQPVQFSRRMPPRSALLDAP